MIGMIILILAWGAMSLTCAWLLVTWVEERFVDPWVNRRLSERLGLSVEEIAEKRRYYEESRGN